MKKIISLLFTILFLIPSLSLAQSEKLAEQEAASGTESAAASAGEAASLTSPEVAKSEYPLTEDEKVLNRYTEKFWELSEEIILAMMKDDSVTAYKSTAAIRLFRIRHAKEVVGKDKKFIERLLLRRLGRADSAFVQVETMHTLCTIDRYRYFNSLIPALILKLDHHNTAVSNVAYYALNDLIESGNSRTREARVVFNTLRKVLFLSRKRLATVTEPDQKLAQKLTLLRWAVKVLGIQELERLPKEVLNLL